MQGAWVCCEKIAETGGAARERERERERDACAETTESTYIFFKEASFLIYCLYKYQTTILYIYIPYLTTSTSVWPSSELVDQSNMLPQLLDPKKWHWGRQEPLARAPAVPSEKVFGVGARSNQSLLRRYDWSPTVGIGALLVAPSSLGVALEQTDGPYCGCGPLVTLQTIPCTLRPVVLTCLDRLSPLNPSGFGGSVMLLHGVCVFLLHFQMFFFGVYIRSGELLPKLWRVPSFHSGQVGRWSGLVALLGVSPVHWGRSVSPWPIHPRRFFRHTTWGSRPFAAWQHGDRGRFCKTTVVIWICFDPKIP